MFSDACKPAGIVAQKQQLCCACSLLLLFTLTAAAASAATFTVDYNRDVFQIRPGNGSAAAATREFRYISGSIHYFRVPAPYWEDRLDKMRAAGLNTIQTYIPWNAHQPHPDTFDFADNLDLVSFIKLAAAKQLLVILRPGPYIDNLNDFGGLPYWLLSMGGRENPVKIRTSDPRYEAAVYHYYSRLLPLVRPLLYENGGPVIGLQVENEYGSYPACDRNHMHNLNAMIRQLLGVNLYLFTTDGNGAGYLNCGKTDGIYATVDFGAGAPASFAAQRQFQRHGPPVNSEYYPGWHDYWGKPYKVVSDQAAAHTLDLMLAQNASVNIYMFEGGTNFDLNTGADLIGGEYLPVMTSYDYNAPLTEAGDITSKYLAIRDVISKYVPGPLPPVPVSLPKRSYGHINLTRSIVLFSAIPTLVPRGPVRTSYPLSMEDIQQDYGFILYTHNISKDYGGQGRESLLNTSTINDRAYVFVNNNYAGLLSRALHIHMLGVSVKKSDTLAILVENQGRIAHGPNMYELKGILSNVTINGDVLEGWHMYPLPLNDTSKLFPAGHTSSPPQPPATNTPTFYHGQFTVPDTLPALQDTYIDTTGWFKGILWLNGHMLGRYWPVAGPQRTLYLPACWLRTYPDPNDLLLFEQEFSSCARGGAGSSSCGLRSVSRPVLNATTADLPGERIIDHRHMVRG